MRIHEFLREEPNNYESLGIPGVPKTLTRTSLRSYRARLTSFINKLTSALRAVNRYHYYEIRAAARLPSSRGWRSASMTPWLSRTKAKRRMERILRQRGMPQARATVQPEHEREHDLQTKLLVANNLLTEIDLRLPNMPSEGKAPAKRRPPPEISEFE